MPTRTTTVTEIGPNGTTTTTTGPSAAAPPAAAAPVDREASVGSATAAAASSNAASDTAAACPGRISDGNATDAELPLPAALAAATPTPPGRLLKLIHFNDVYNIQPSKPTTDDPTEVVGGAARFVRLVESFREGGARFDGMQPCVLFSGDAFNPSIMSTVTKGKQMVPVLNRMHIDCAVYGNHDFDFGVGSLIELKDRCHFPWLLSNVRDAASGDQLASGLPQLLIEHGGVTIGLLGLVEEEWIATLATLEPEDIVFEDPVACANRLGPALRAAGADVVIALTHMRGPRDERLARMCGGGAIDLILGGHDHEYEVNRYPSANGVGDPLGTWVIKSGTDFRDLSTIEVTVGPPSGGACIASRVAVAVTVAAPVRVSVTAAMAEDHEVAEIVAQFEARLTADLDKPIGEAAVELDCRFGAIRARETAIGNFVADCMRQGVKPVPDVTLINSGTLRADRTIPPGVITMLDLTALLPLLDPLVVVALTGEQLVEALENGVSAWPALEGRWPLTSGVRFAFDPGKPAGSRVSRASVVVGGDPLDEARTYTLLTKEYLATGKDGYTVFKDCRVVQDAEQNPMLSGLIRRYFLQHAVVNAWSRPTSPVEALVKKAAARLVLGINSPSRLLRRNSSRDNLECYAIAPQVDGRIARLEPPEPPEVGAVVALPG